MIDSYSLKARIYPTILVLLPILAIGIFFSIQFESFVHSLSSLGLVGVFGYLLSQLGRDRGKKKENELWKSWGGAPTTQLLRLTDTSIDKYTKERYHAKMKQLCPTPDQPNLAAEQEDTTSSDDIYKAWTIYLIGKTRDAKTFGLLLKENTSYGFRRNLWALKSVAIVLIIIIAAVNYLVSFRATGVYDPREYSSFYWGLNFILLIGVIFWIVAVTPTWVKTPAFAYAHRLCESIDNF